MLLLEQNINRKGQKDENITQLKFEVGNNKEYKVETIWNGAVYKKES